MNILIVNKFLYPRGGAETYVLDIGPQLAAEDHHVQYFGMDDLANEVGNELNLYTDQMDFHQMSLKAVTYPFRLIYSREAYRKMRAVCLAFKPDVVHLNNFNYQLTPSVIDAARDCGIPVVVTAHDSQFVCANHLLYNPNTNSICTLCVEHGDPSWCARMNCIHGSHMKSLIGMKENKYYRTHSTYDWISAIICPSKFMKSIYDSDSRFLNKTVYLQNYVNSVRAENLPVWSGNNENSYFLYFGRLAPEKGVINLLNAAKAFPDEKFYFAGSGPLANEVIEASENSNITFLGFKNKEELKKLIAEAKCVILPSTCYENCPLSVIEAQQLHAPVIAPGYGGSAELIDARYQIKDTSEEALEDAIKRVLCTPDMLDKMSADSASRATSYTNLKEYCNELLRIYEDVSNAKD